MQTLAHLSLSTIPLAAVSLVLFLSGITSGPSGYAFGAMGAALD